MPTSTARERMTESMVCALDNFDLEAERIRIDILKVDRSFVRQIGDPVDGSVESTEDRAITDANLAMGKTLSLTVVAERVETLEQEIFQQYCEEMLSQVKEQRYE